MCELALTCDPLVKKGLFTAATMLASSLLGHYPTIAVLHLAGHKTADMGGKWIGFTERALVSILVLSGLAAQATFIFATKAAVMGLRMPRGVQNQKRTVEYMLIGTMTSFLTALLIGFLGKEIWSLLK